MTGLRFMSLGFAPSTGKQAIEQAVAFKRQMRAVLKSIDGAYLMVVTHEDHRCEVKVAYEPERESWARRAVEKAPEVWETIAERRKEVAR